MGPKSGSYLGFRNMKYLLELNTQKILKYTTLSHFAYGASLLLDYFFSLKGTTLTFAEQLCSVYFRFTFENVCKFCGLAPKLILENMLTPFFYLVLNKTL